MKSFQGMTNDELTLIRDNLILDVADLRTEMDDLNNRIMEIETELNRRKRKKRRQRTGVHIWG